MMDGGKRRSFLHGRLEEAGAVFADVGGGAMAAMTVGDDDGGAARRLGLADLSPLPRLGYKGAGAPAWLRQRGLTLPAAANTATVQRDGALVAALSAQEHLLLAPLAAPAGGGDVPDSIAVCGGAWSLDAAAQCYQLPRVDSHCWLALCGEHAGDTLAKLCGVDLRPSSFPAGALAQTSVARVNAIVLSQPRGEVALFHLLADSASAEYLWDCLLDAMGEFEGGVVGLAALRAMDGGA